MILLYVLFFLLLGNSFSSFNVEGLHAENILNGELATAVKFKYVVAVIYRINKTSFECPCTGGILSNWYIATTAHCFYNKTTGNFINKLFEVVTSTVDLKNPTFVTRYIRVGLVYMPKIYQPRELDTYSTKGDLAIVKLRDRLGFSTYSTAIKELMIPRQLNRSPQDQYTVAGYGWNELVSLRDKFVDYINFLQNGRTDYKLRHASAYILTDYECRRAIGDRIAEGNMCARIKRADPLVPSGVCQFDSGASLVHNDYLDGIAINGFLECDEYKMPAIYINITYYKKFINSAMSGNVTDDMRVIKLEQREREFIFTQLI